MREKERERDRQTDRQTQRQTQRHKEKERDRQRQTETLMHIEEGWKSQIPVRKSENAIKIS